MEYIKTNKLIAEFMGAKYNKDVNFDIDAHDVWLPHHGICNYTTIEIGKGKTLQYHRSWDWLMPVCESIEALNYASSTLFIPGFGHRVSFDSAGAFTDGTTPPLIYVIYDTKMEAYYNSVVRFIQWYNSNSCK